MPRNALIEPDVVAAAVAKDFGLPALTSCTLVGRAFNDTYLLRTDRDRFICRVYLNGKYYIRDSTDFLFELELLEFVRERGVRVAAPLHRRDGELLGRLPGHDREYAVFEFAEGVEVQSLNTSLARRLGAELARFHCAADEFASPHHRYHLGVEFLLEQPYALIRGDEARDKLMDLTSVPPLEELIDVIRGLPTSNGSYGLIHADPHPGNVHFSGNAPTFFDFDHCAYGWRAYDLAVLCLDRRDAIRDAVLEGYESIRAVSVEERAAFPTFGYIRRIWDEGDILAMRPAWEGRGFPPLGKPVTG